ncbi:hypothetical protein F511_32160 [Dorcoceras hygrometricum]|uniref:Uncharacterized protein n=1 Tax=Dorcoceras hygrometricum TaxID=472368 RepID=A0A2Z7CTW9_9LAMI|nr:hypothetical protein F511_32160 [Dorcoceras hygrometricum]
MVLVWVVPTADCNKLKESRLEVCKICAAADFSRERSGFQPREPSRFGVPSRPQFPGQQQAQANAFTREQADEIPSGVIQGNSLWHRCCFDITNEEYVSSSCIYLLRFSSCMVLAFMNVLPVVVMSKFDDFVISSCSLAFKMVQVRQLVEDQQVKLESADGWRCVYPRPTFSVSKLYCFD